MAFDLKYSIPDVRIYNYRLEPDEKVKA